MKQKSTILTLATMLLSSLAAGCYAPSNPDAKYDPTLREAEQASCEQTDDTAVMADQVLQLVNLERGAAGLPPVALNPVLDEIAGDYACRMIENGFFAHRDPETDRGPGERAVAGKYKFYAVGENLAAGQETAAQAIQVWMDSPSHKKIILDPQFKEIGIAVRQGGEHGIYWVQLFGDPVKTTVPQD